MSRRRALVFLVLNFCLCAISPSVSAQVLRRGNQEPQSVDPHKSANLFEGTIEHDLYEGLVVYAPGGALAGGSAKSWNISPDGTIYTFHLRPGLRWSNGEPLTAEDFVYSFRRLVDPATKSPSATLATPVKNAEEISTGKNAKVEQLGIEAVGSDVVRITLSTPTPYFISALTNSCFAPVNRKAVVQSGGTLGQPQTSITNGAYLLDTWSPGSRLALKKNPYYWDAAHVQIPEVHYLPMPVASKEFQLYLDGELDITWDVPADQIPKLRARRSDEFKLFPFFGNYYYGFDLKSLPFKDNPKLRQALAMAIEREAITSEITGGGELRNTNSRVEEPSDRDAGTGKGIVFRSGLWPRQTSQGSGSHGQQRSSPKDLRCRRQTVEGRAWCRGQPHYRGVYPRVPGRCRGRSYERTWLERRLC
jgi:oligopeptide transport system substrate-binding protein